MKSGRHRLPPVGQERQCVRCCAPAGGESCANRSICAAAGAACRTHSCIASGSLQICCSCAELWVEASAEVSAQWVPLQVRETAGPAVCHAVIKAQTLTSAKDCLLCLQLAAACLELEDGYRPPITFVVVQKRHHTRLYTDDPSVMDRSGNVSPGGVLALQLKCT